MGPRYATTSSCGVGTLRRLSAALARSPVVAHDDSHDDKLIDCVEPDAGCVNRRDGGSAVFVKTLKDLKAAGREKVVAGGSARTVRFLTKDDGLGFTMSDVRLDAGQQNVLWYKHHWEANYILEGRGEVRDLTTDETWVLETGVMYIVGPDDRHSM